MTEEYEEEEHITTISKVSTISIKKLNWNKCNSLNGIP